MNPNVDRWGTNILILLIVIAVGLWSQAQASQAEQALCALRQNLETRVQDSEQYLEDVRSGAREPVPGITSTDINRSLENQRATIRALGSLRCS